MSQNRDMGHPFSFSEIRATRHPVWFVLSQVSKSRPGPYTVQPATGLHLSFLLLFLHVTGALPGLRFETWGTRLCFGDFPPMRQKRPHGWGTQCGLFIPGLKIETWGTRLDAIPAPKSEGPGGTLTEFRATCPETGTVYCGTAL